MTKKEKKDFLTKSPQEIYEQYKKVTKNSRFIKVYNGALAEEASEEDIWDSDEELLTIDIEAPTRIEFVKLEGLDQIKNNMDLFIQMFETAKQKAEETACLIMEKFNVSRDKIEVEMYQGGDWTNCKILSMQLAFYIVETEIESFDDFEIRVNEFKRKNTERLRKQLEVSGYSSQLI